MPAGLKTALGRALAKEPGDRYHEIPQFLAALSTPASTPPRRKRKPASDKPLSSVAQSRRRAKQSGLASKPQPFAADTFEVGGEDRQTKQAAGKSSSWGSFAVYSLLAALGSSLVAVLTKADFFFVLTFSLLLLAALFLFLAFASS